MSDVSNFVEKLLNKYNPVLVKTKHDTYRLEWVAKENESTAELQFEEDNPEEFESKPHLKKYTWELNPDTPIWSNGMEDSINDCIRKAMETYPDILQVGDIIYIAECETAEIEPSLNHILEQVEQAMYEQVGEVSESWNISSACGRYSVRQPIYEEYERKLKILIDSYIQAIGETPSFYHITNIQAIQIEL